MALITTPGAADADSYATLVELTAYLSNRLPVATLASQTDATKESAMRMAARLLDRSFDWTGAAVDDVQGRSWPRSGMLTPNGYPIGTTAIPQLLKDAQCEFAAQVYASDRISDNDAQNQGITSVKAGSVAVSFAELRQDTAEAADITIRKKEPDLQWASRVVPDAVRQLIPESWYRQHSIKRPFIFGSSV